MLPRCQNGCAGTDSPPPLPTNKSERGALRSHSFPSSHFLRSNRGMDPFVGRMRPNASADEAGIYVQCHPSFPFADGYPNRHQQPVTALSFKTSNTRAQDHTSKISMDQLSLHYSYLNLNDSQALIAAPDSNFQNVGTWLSVFFWNLQY